MELDIIEKVSKFEGTLAHAKNKIAQSAQSTPIMHYRTPNPTKN
jgi:hypothetical protein